MAKFRQLKLELRERALADNWQEYLAKLAILAEPQEYVGPLFALLPQAGLLHWRGVAGLGVVVPALACLRMEDARVVLRRLMWHMNEESGNIGWGIAEAMGEVLGHSPPLAKEFSRVLFSYILNSGRDDNYIDHPPLLRGCFWGAGRLAQLRPDLAWAAKPRFVAGLSHADALVRGQAVLALCKALEAGAVTDPYKALEAGAVTDPRKVLEAGEEGLVGLPPKMLVDLQLARPDSQSEGLVGLPPELLGEAKEKLGKMLNNATECEDYDGEKILTPLLGELAARALVLLG